MEKWKGGAKDMEAYRVAVGLRQADAERGAPLGLALIKLFSFFSLYHLPSFLFAQTATAHMRSIRA